MTTAPCPAGLLAALADVGLSWEELTHGASGVLLFGSRACDLNREDSDWDVLCIGTGPTRPRSKVDIVWVGRTTAGSPRWLGSELASHVRAFGRPLWGDCKWADDIRLSPNAVRTKRRRIMGRISTLEHLWPAVQQDFKTRHVRLLRRELQRASLLEQGKPVPPSSRLDDGWANDFPEGNSWDGVTAWMRPVESARTQLLCGVP